MSKLCSGGNPSLDRIPSEKRFKEIILPIFQSKGFVRINGRSNTLVNRDSNTIIIVSSCPSQTTMYGNTKSNVSKYKRIYGSDVTIYVLYSRDYSEWVNKPVYQSTLSCIMRIGGLRGIITGIKNIQVLLDKMTTKERFFTIS